MTNYLFLSIKKSLLLPAAYLLSAFNPCLAIPTSEPIDTNRPSFLNSPTEVPVGSIQFENGTQFYGYRKKQYYFDVPETQVRIGIFPETELQLTVPYYVLQNIGGVKTSNVPDLTEVGFKHNLMPDNSRLDVGVIASLTLPTGNPRISGPGLEPVVRIPATFQLNKRWSLGTMQSILVLNNGRDVQWQPDFIVTRLFGWRTAAFVEYGGFFTQREYPSNLIHFGGTYKTSRTQQVDMHFGFGMNKAAPSAFVGVGYSFRLGGIKGKN